nr:unnamed protein product [Callosobruchus analis]
MEVYRLLGDELTYELLIRGLPIGNTVAEKRALLRDALRVEKENLSAPPQQGCGIAQEELPKCSTKLRELKEAILHFDVENREDEFTRIYTRLLHVSGRLPRLSCEGDEAEERKDLMERAIQMLGELNHRYTSVTAVLHNSTTNARDAQQEPGDRPSNTSLIDAPIDKLPELVNRLEKASFFSNGQETPFPDTKALSATKSSGKVRFNESPASAFTPAEVYRSPRAQPSSLQGQLSQPPGKDPLGVGMVDDIPANSTFQGTTLNPNANLYAPTHHDYFAPRWSHVDVGRWNVKFNGRNSVTDFLERIEELRISRGVSKERLFQSAAELFTHDALLWYRTAQVSSWDELCTQLKQMFQPYDYEYSLWDEIRRRTQGAQEHVGNYIVVMENLFRKLPTPVSESTKRNLIMRNLLPSFQTQLALHPVNSVSQLMTLARSIEEAVQRAQKYQPPPTSARGLLEPELRYRRTEGFPQYANPLSAVPPSNSQSDVPSDLGENQSSRIPIVAAVSNASKCWNCGSTQHKFRSCPDPRKRFCFKCGQPNVTLAHCPSCRKNCQRSQQ